MNVSVVLLLYYIQIHMIASIHAVYNQCVLCVFALSAIASILRAWLDQCSEDFREPPDYPCLLKLLDYLKKNIPGSDPEKRAQNLLEQFQNQEVESDSKLPFPSIFLVSQTVRYQGIYVQYTSTLMLIDNIVRLTSDFFLVSLKKK